MKKVIITLCLIGSALLVLDGFDVGHAAAMFLLAGVIPGTNATIGASYLLEAYALIIGFMAARATFYIAKLVVGKLLLKRTSSPRQPA